ncbi:carboxymuconolactone decarboxylase family protein [Mucilaginibacter sp. KACC 22773]|uniref:carboxymuconolactone decarboxylase family protein n=1 Tax=Mucilaginibacter sp. KACC 22773 TaxID=3025671 RepID=UPI0023668766|nr:carboxymuconolactone decarboxylase family protein [Mucilaginibacter sp. KACC 22773]WDF77213.1 carboxymuconolactone decarboxylase family protein [Mucilaginibacter sp. KACC 22773]
MMKEIINYKPVLCVVTSNSVKGKSGQPTGFWLSELTHPLAKLEAAGVKVELASIKGGEPPIDGFDLADPINARFWNDENFREALRTTQSLDDVNPFIYSTIFFAGGHGTMWDFPESSAVRRVTRQIYENGGVVSAVCHGPAALVNVVLSDGSYLVSGKRVTSFTNDEEAEVQATDVVPFLLADALAAHGAVHYPAPNWNSNVIVDGRLITGQNPASAAGVGEAILGLLKTYAPATQVAEQSAAPHSAITPEDVNRVSPALAKYTHDAIVNDLWKRPDLSLRDRSLVTLSSLIMGNRIIGMLHYFNLSLDNGVTPAEISEIITHLAFYAGWSNSFSAIAMLKDIFDQRGIGADQLPSASPELVPIELAVPDEEARVAFIHQNIAPVAPGLEQYTGDLLYHEVWLRPGLTPRDRSLVTVSALMASGYTQFLPFYLSRAITHGLTKAQIAEILTHLGFYSGWPNALSSTLVVKGFFESTAN